MKSKVLSLQILDVIIIITIIKVMTFKILNLVIIIDIIKIVAYSTHFNLSWSSARFFGKDMLTFSGITMTNKLL